MYIYIFFLLFLRLQIFEIIIKSRKKIIYHYLINPMMNRYTSEYEMKQ